MMGSESCSSGRAERTLVFAWRMLVMGRGGCARLHEELETIAGDLAPELLLALGAFLMALGNASRRKLSVGHPGCRHRTADELAMLALIAAAQVGDEARLAAHLRWMARPDDLSALHVNLAGLADLTRRAGFGLALPPAGGQRVAPNDGVRLRSC
jgi:hypothetical protein